MRSRMLKVGLAGIAAAMLGATSLMAHDDDHDRGDRDGKFRVSAKLEGFQEVPAVSSTGKAFFSAVVDTTAMTITWRLRFEGLEGGNTTQSHVHFGQLSVNGGVSFFLCSNLTTPAPPPGTQACPNVSGELSGVITPADIIGPAGQGIEAASFAEIAAAMKDGTAYANIHSDRWLGGEIRGQLH